MAILYTHLEILDSSFTGRKMSYIDKLNMLKALSDEELRFMYRDGQIYLNNNKWMFFVVYNRRLDRERIEYIAKDDYIDEEYDRGTTLSEEDIAYLNKQIELTKEDESTILITQDERNQLSTQLSSGYSMTIRQAEKYISSMSAIFAISMLGSIGIYKDIDLKYGTNPVLSALNSEAHVHLHNLIGFVGLCDVCLGTVNLSDAMRKPLVEGGWEGWYCSEECMSEYILNSGEDEVNLTVYMDMWRIISS